jgi:signal peptidase II
MAREVPPSRWLVFLAIALGGAAFDLATKSFVFSRMSPGQVRPVLEGVLEIHLTHNTGALWGFGGTLPFSTQIFAVLSIAAGLAIVYWLFVRRAARDLWLTVALGLIMAGAIGNCYDRLRLGHVRDFVHLHVDPYFDCAIFNFADNMLVLGAVSLMILALRPDPEAAARSAQDTATQVLGPAAPPATDGGVSSPGQAS